MAGLTTAAVGVARCNTSPAHSGRSSAGAVLVLGH